MPRRSVLNSAEFAPWGRIVIAADAVLVLPDDRTASRYPFAVARDEFSFLLSIARAWHVAQVRIAARAPLRDAGEGAERPETVGDLDVPGIGRLEDHRRPQQRECHSDASARAQWRRHCGERSG